ncbi:hypothetical protein NHQ30_011528 [Ciborinia camelliae]|nr:hypothetical protein NHQ30_011528 [Ciborinia camelliae]
MLKTWVGPDYREISQFFLDYTSGEFPCQILFLRREVYGDRSDRDWPPEISFRLPMLKTLSNPYRMGLEWYPRAAREMINMMCHWEGFNIATSQDNWDDAQNKGSCLYKWVHRYDDNETTEESILKDQLLEFETRVWKPMMTRWSDDTETEISMTEGNGESEMTTTNDSGPREPTDAKNRDQGIKRLEVLLGSVLIFSALMLRILT